MKLRDVPTSYLKWMIEKLRGGDFDNWALAAEKIYNEKMKEETDQKTLEDQADNFLRNHGFNPHKL